MFHSNRERKEISKWLIGIISVCILIYLGIRHINQIWNVFMLLIDLIQPLIIGFIFAMALNVPMKVIERWFHRKTSMKKGVRPLSILLSLLLVFGILIGVTVLVIPELLDAVKLIIQILNNGIEQMAILDENMSELLGKPGIFLEKVDIDWLELKERLETLIKSYSSVLVNQAVDATGTVFDGIVTMLLSLVFAIYILSGKEKLKRQTKRFIRVWMPEKINQMILYIYDVFSKTFQRFVVGQVTEAIILGTLCMIGMVVLRIPYAPMVGALIGVTALIPVVGAYVGAFVGAIMIFTVNPFKTFVFLVFLVILQQVEGNMIYPKVVGAKIKLPAIWVLTAVLVGGKLGGPIGMLLGVPAVSAICTIAKEATDKRERKNMMEAGRFDGR